MENITYKPGGCDWQLVFKLSEVFVLLRSICSSTLYVNKCIRTLLNKITSQMQWVNPTDKINTTSWISPKKEKKTVDKKEV